MILLKINYSNRVYGLDIFRAIAILLVVAGHGKFILGDLVKKIPSVQLIDGVELFFVLSGFLIGSILIKKFENDNKFTFSSLFHFWKNEGI